MLMFFRDTCAICVEDKLNFRQKKNTLGVILTREFCCENCGAIFIEDELRWKLVQMKNKYNPIWKQFQHKSLYVREWVNIGQECTL